MGALFAHESSAMFSRAARIGKSVAEMTALSTFVAGLAFGPKMVGNWIDGKQEEGENLQVSSLSLKGKEYDVSDDTWAQRVVEDTKKWRETYRPGDKEATEQFKRSGIAPEGLDVCFDYEGNRLSDVVVSEYTNAALRNIAVCKKRDLLEQERKNVADLLKQAHYDQSFIDDVLSKMFVFVENAGYMGAVIGLDGIGIQEEYLQDTKNPAFAQVILHEVAHYEAVPGHQMRKIGFFDGVREERCVELTSMEHIARIFGLKALESLGRQNLEYKHAKKLGHILYGVNDFFSRCGIKILNAGYIAHSQNVRKVIADGVEREQLEEAQGLLEKIDRAERA